jgi:pyochelin biosynthesis protein PchC
MRNRAATWLRCLTEPEFPTATLVCFPHSGGGFGSYAPWVRAMRPDVRLLAVQYPGRGDRLGEDPAAGVREMALSVAAELGSAGFACALFGHSLGALVAYETAVALRDRGIPPTRLFVSGAVPPQRAAGRQPMRGEDLWATVCGLGGVPPEVAADDELVALLLPALRADVAAHESYRPRADIDPLSCPVRCYHGLDDPLVDADLLAGWAEISTGEFTAHTRPGAHFHPFDDPDGLVNDILAAI